ncbi:filensin-like isoform X1 [Salvelinus sp. IW2-2015]|uniref:filensin-like isoform X1 n=1 Tax=Salvelinus sp. IW2-2015 TaxID=2691554 RepID=UPI000CDF8828|nr:filensin-like isoform X1 [Salvelinus alpinus]
MHQTSYMHEVRKEKYERSDVFEEPYGPDASAGASAIQGWESLQELNSRFARYINRARVLEQRNAVFRKQLETLQRMEEASGLEEAFTEQIGLNQQRIRELSADRAKLERELKDSCRMLDEFTNKYRNECEYQEQLRGTLEQLNKEADYALLRNLEFQIHSQFLQDDINSIKDRHRKNLAEIQTYVNILHQINQTITLVPNVAVGISEEQEKQLAQRRVPALQSQLEEYKSALCQLQAQKLHLQTETSVMENSIKSTQESYDDEIQLYNEQIESLRKDIEEAERSLEKYTNECRHLAMYQISLENELERYKRIIENEDNRLNSAIIGTPITLFTTNYRFTHTPTVSSRGRDITQAIQDISSVKPRQKNLAKKVMKKKEISPKDVMDSGQDERVVGAEHMEDEKRGMAEEEDEVNREKQSSLYTGVPPQDVPDGAQISKAFDTLCNIVRDRMRKYKKPEPIADFYTKGRYVLVTGDGSYPHPHFYTSSPSAGHVFVTICDGMVSPYDPFSPYTPSPDPPHPQPMPPPCPSIPTPPSDGEGGKGDDKGGKGGGKGKSRDVDPTPPPQPNPAPAPGPDPKDPKCPSNPSGPKGGKDDSRRRGLPPMPSPRGASSMPPDSMSYEKVEMVESVEKFSNDRKTKGYEETAMVVETMIEKTSKKKH